MLLLAVPLLLVLGTDAPAAASTRSGFGQAPSPESASASSETANGLRITDYGLRPFASCGFQHHQFTKQDVGDLPVTKVPRRTQLQEDRVAVLLRATERLQARPEVLLAVQRAAARWEVLLGRRAIVVLDVDFGPDLFGGEALPADVLGLTMPVFVEELPWADVRAALPAAQQDLLSSPTLVFEMTPPDGRRLRLTQASAQTLGLLDTTTAELLAAPGGALTRIAFNDQIAWDFDPANGIERNRFDFEALAAHEIGHALGFASGLEDLGSGALQAPTLLDAWRVRPEDLATTPSLADLPRVARRGPDRTSLHILADGAEPAAPFTNGIELQPSHWLDHVELGTRPTGLLQPRQRRGEALTITQADRRAFAALGWQPRPLGQQSSLQTPDALQWGILPEGTLELGAVHLANPGATDALYAIDFAALEPSQGRVAVPPEALSGSSLLGRIPPSATATVRLRLAKALPPGRYSALLLVRKADENDPIATITATFELREGPFPTAWVVE